MPRWTKLRICFKNLCHLYLSHPDLLNVIIIIIIITIIALIFLGIFFPIGTTAPVGLGLPPWNSPFHIGFFLNHRQSVGLLGRVISSSQGLYLHTEQYAE
jgi:hypothetical protein